MLLAAKPSSADGKCAALPALPPLYTEPRACVKYDRPLAGRAITRCNRWRAGRGVVGCGAGSWGWSCAANGRAERQCWSSGIRARGKSSTGIWQKRSGCGGQRKSAPVRSRNSDSPRRNVRVRSRNARVRRPSVDGQQRSERGHWRSNSGHSLRKAVRRNASLSSQGQECSAGRPVQYQASPSRARPFQPQEMADWASPQACPRAHNACHIQEFVTSDSCPKLLERIHRFFGPPLRTGRIGNQDQVCI